MYKTLFSFIRLLLVNRVVRTITIRLVEATTLPHHLVKATILPDRLVKATILPHPLPVREHHNPQHMFRK